MNTLTEKQELFDCYSVLKMQALSWLHLPVYANILPSTIS